MNESFITLLEICFFFLIWERNNVIFHTKHKYKRSVYKCTERKTTYYWNELDEKLINFYQRKESCHETIHVHEQQLQRNNKTALIKHDTCILKSFVSVSTKKVLFLCCGKTNYVMFCYRDFLGGWEKLHRENEKSVVFPESRYVTYTYFGPDFSTRRWNFPTRWLDFFLIGEKLLLSFSPMCFCQRSKFRFRGITLVISIEHN